MNLLCPAVIALTCGSSIAAPLDSAWIGPESTWMVHVDVEALAQTTIGSLFMDHIRDEMNIDVGEVQLGDHHELSPQQVRTIIQSLNEVKDITVVGTADQEDPSLVVVRAGPGVLDVIEMLKTQEGLRTVVQDGRAIVLLDEDKEGHDQGNCLIVQPTGLPNENYVVLAESVESLVQHIGQAEARRRGGGRGAPEWAQPDREAFIQVYFDSVGDFVNDPNVPVVGQGGKLRLSLGEQNQRLNARLVLDAGSDQEAQDMVTAMQGFMAMGRLMMSGEPELAELQPFLNGISLRSEGPSLLIQADWDAKAIRTLMEEHIHDHHHDHEDDVHIEVETDVEIEVETDGDR